MKPTITAVDGSPEFAPGVPSYDPRFGGAQSITVTGSGLTGADAAFVGGPSGWEPLRVYDVTDTSLVILPAFSAPGQYQILIATIGGISDPFVFRVA